MYAIRPLLTAPLLAGALILSGCDGGAAPPATGAEKVVVGTAATSPEETEETAPDEEAPEEEAPQEDGATALGATFTYPDGLLVTIDPPEQFTLSEYAVASGEFPHYVTFAVTVDNGTDAVFNPRVFVVDAVSAGRDAVQFTDYPGGIGAAPDQDIAPNDTLTWLVGFGLDDPWDVVVTATPDYDRGPATFTS